MIQTIRHADHAGNMRADVAGAESLRELDQASSAARNALKSRNPSELIASLARLENAIEKVFPYAERHFMGELVEVVAVALGVAMACRSYFIQPFKIPTGSMQPSLYGIHFEPLEKQGISDRYPLNCGKWIVTGQWYKEIRSRTTGRVKIVPEEGVSNGIVIRPQGVAVMVGNAWHDIPPGMRLAAEDNATLSANDVIARGLKIAGDHVFVNRLRWNIFAPRRSEVMVFLTTGIERMDADNRGKHYIKRMTGLPGDTISICDPDILVNGVPVKDNMIGRIARGELGNGGYHLAIPALRYETPLLRYEYESIKLGPDEYIAMGDNTLSSLDSRFWGPVPRKNLVGPASFVYWPFSPRWGPISR